MTRLSVLIVQLLLLTLQSRNCFGATPVYTVPNPDGTTTVNIDEGTGTGADVLTLAATDAGGGTITYSITSQNPGTKFSITGSQIKTADTFDYETAADRTFTITVQAQTDSDSSTEDVTFTVNINDVNDETPVITVTTGTVNLTEEQPTGTTVGFSYTATDPDAGDVLIYSLSGEDTYFQIDSGTGTITTNQPIDFETAGTSTFSLTLTVKDSASPQHAATAALTVTLVDINDNTPVFNPATYYVSIAENTPQGTSVALLTVNDADAGTTVTVAITSGDDATAKFTVVGSQIETSATAIDYDALEAADYKYTLVVTGDDTANTGTATVIVTITGVNEHDPVWSTFSPAYTDATTPYNMAENTAIGSTILTIQATDADKGNDGEVVYSISSITNSGGGTTTGLFYLDQVTGVLTTTSSSFDRDTATGGNAYFDLTLRASDQGGTPKTVERVVRIGLTDYNDNAPTFSQPTYIYSMSENVAASTALLTVAASDDDLTSVLSYSILTSSTPSDYSTFFELDGTIPNQINLKAIVNLDAPNNHASSYILHIEVTDGGTPELSGTTTVYITVTTNNDNTPTFAPTTVTASIDETAPTGTSVVTMVATDDDAGDDGIITYSISGGNTNNKFSIDSSSGEVNVAGTLDFENQAQYTLTILAIDGGGSTLTGTATLTINVGDISDETPSCTTNSFSETISELTAATTTVATLNCNDNDAVDTLSYSIASGNTGSKFNIDGSGVITLAQLVDYDAGETSFSLVVQVTDGTTTLEIPVDVTVSPVNEDPPTFASSPTVSVAENQAVGYTLITYAASDADSSPHDIIKHEISAVSNSGAGLFSIDQTSAVIRLAQTLDYESQTVYEITVEAEDGGGLKGTGTVTVLVTNVNDVAPTCNPSSYVQSVPENTAINADIIASFGCSDSDSGTLTYTITLQTPASVFTLDTTGTPKLTLGTLVDYETTTAYQLQVTVSDGTGAGSLSTTIFIDISVTDTNDGGPSFAQTTYTESIIESTSVSTAIVTIAATDPDSATSDFGKLSYSFLSGNTGSKFNIDPSTGQVSVAGVLDADTAPTTYNLVIQAIEASNQNSASTTLAVTVTDVNDNSPTCTSGYTFSVTFAEEGTAGDDMTTLTCSDGDGDTLTYTLTNGGTNFQMNNNILELKAAIDYDSSPSSEFPVTIQVSDGTNSVNVIGSVTVTSVNEHTPAFTQTTYTASHTEDSSPGTTIATVSATDADSDASITYQWVAAQTVFTLDQASGVILLVSSLDRETLDSYSLLVRASDGTNVVTATVALTVLDVNDNSPVFNPTSYSGTVTENAATGAVLTVAATDLDDPATNNYGTVSYGIASGAAGKFNIGAATGILSTTSVLDYEDATSYTIHIQAYDSSGGAGALTSTIAVTVTVDPVNENNPVFTSTSYSATVAESAAIGQNLVQVVATDSDDGDDGVVYYSMTANANFYLNTGTGEIFVQQSLDFEGTPTHTFEVVAHDSGVVPNSATVVVTITVTNVNDVSPVCAPVLQTVSFQEISTTVSSTIASLTCTDGDTATLAYTISSVNGAPTTGIFSVGATTGVITLATALDYETDASYNILLQVSDGGTPDLSTTATVQVTVTDYNEADPVFNPATYTTTISETTALSTTVFTVAATDADTSDTVTYSINPANTYFTIDSNNGEVITKSTIDYDTLPNPKEIEINILATDDGASPNLRTATVTATVTITDDNDITPLFNPGVYTAQISENDAASTTVTIVTATDSEGTTPTYSLANDFTIFQVNANGDIVIANQNQDYETTTSYAIVVYAADAASNTGTATVHVTITNYNEHSPVLTATTGAVSLAENSVAGTTIVDVDATDADAGVDGDITYSIATVPVGFETTFAIVPTTGVVSVAGVLDREAVTNPLTILIDATDGGTTPGVNMVQFTLTLTITDENDNTPSCPTSLYTVDVAENTVATTTVSTIVCTDADTDNPNNAITYTITAGNAANHFDIDGNTGVVTVATGALIDYETVTSYLLTVQAADGGVTALTGTTSLSITVTDVNDNDPTFVSNTYTFSVTESVALSSTIGQVVASDLDSGLAATLVFSIQNGNLDNNMAIDGNTGEIKVVGAFDYESRDVYSLEVIATDSLVTIRTGTTFVTISVSDVNDVTPSCTPVLQTVTFAEDTAVNTLIGTVTCTDTDTGTDGTVSYVIATVDGVATSTPFSIVTATGAVSLATALDYESDTAKTVIVHGIDGGGLTGSATINVIVTNINDNNPTFTNTPYTQSVSETTALSTSIFKVTATDADVDDVITYTINSASTVFNIDPSDGTIYLIDTLDYESTQTYEVTVIATDTGAAAATATVTIAVTDSNDGIPVFSPAVYIASVAENNAVGTTVTTVTATDADTPTLTYSFFSGNGDSVFRIEASGEIIIDDPTNLDFDSATKSYTLVVHATDGTNTGTTTVAVAVTNYNEATPVLTQTSSSQNLDENTVVGTSVVTVAATDSDHGQDGEITFTITGGNADSKFSINPVTGEVTLAASLDMEATQTYVITIDATDGGTNPSARSAQYTLTVNVQDINDVTPVCTQSLYSVDVAENTATTTSVLQLVCSDSDNASPNSDISNYNIVSGNTGAAFLVTAGGEVQVNNSPNRESVAAYTLVIDVIDGGTNPSPLTATTTLAITITDVNDNIPSPGQNPYGFSTGEESATGTVVGTVIFADTDLGDAGTVTYSINSGNTDNKFSIDSSTGEIKIVASLDYETASNNPYVLVVLGTDNDAGSPSTGTTTVSITVTDYNDNTASCTPTLDNVQFPENTADTTTLYTLTCTDSDTSNPNNALSYTVVSVNGVLTATPFEVDAVGVVSLATGQLFEFETTTLYRVLIRVNDGGTPSLSSTATVNIDITDVNEFDPVFTSTPYTTNVAETATIGTSVYTVAATDQDTGNTLTYTINPSNIYFDVDPVSGVVYTIDTIDYDTLATNPIALTVVATDDGGTPRSTTETLTITVTDNNDGTPVFNPGVYSTTVAETAPVGTTVVTVTVTDIDDTSWTMSFASGNGDNVFRIDANGEIVVNDVTNLNYDSAVKSYVLVARAVDAGSNTGTCTVAIQVTAINDHTPSLTATTNAVSLAEGSALGTTVDDVDGTDADHGNDGTLTYSISGVTNAGDNLFTIDPTSGLVSLSGALDREIQNTYTVSIDITDAGTNPGPLSVSYTLTVTVTDVNDVIPVCTASVYSGTVGENLPASTSVAQLVCTDSDAEANNNLVNSYTITSGNTGTAFSVSTSGEVTTTAILDRETIDNYLLVIEVADAGTTALTTTTSLTITVSDENDNSPVFTQTTYTLNHDEDVSVGTNLGTVAASDLDIGAAGQFVYSINSGDTDSKFTMDTTTGDLFLTSALDFETASNNPYTLVIFATDSGTPAMIGTATVQMQVNDKNDNTPVCIPVLSAVTFSEATTTTTLTTLSCSDTDSGANAALVYTILSVNGVNGDNGGMFTIDGSGAIRLTLSLDYENTILHTLLVEVSDTGAPALTSTATVNLHVTNANDHAPVFTGTPYTDNVIENTAIGTSVYQVAATDADVGDVITFSVNPASTLFDVNPNTGDIILKAELDFDATPNTHEVIIEATDDGGTPMTGTATVTITVTNFNDGTPEFNPGVYAISVAEDTAVLTTVLTVTITDSDTADTTFTYSILSGNTDNIFGIAGTAKTADITVTDDSSLDYDLGSQTYTLIITASDSVNTGSATVNIAITGVNQHTPALVSASSVQNIPENSPTGTNVVDVDATDADRGLDGSMTYSLISGAVGMFAIDPSSGLVTVSGALDTETTPNYNMLIQVTDAGTNPGAFSATYTLSVIVTDQNDQTPACTSSLYAASLAEDAGTGTSVAQLACSDADVDTPNNDISTYTITSGNAGGEFLISATGEVTTAAVVLDRETTPAYQLVIEVSDSGTTPAALTTTTTLSITITDVNDNDPTFSLAVYNIMTNEDTALHTSIGAVAATDNDIDLAGTIVYSIFSGNGAGKFALDRTTGDITLADSVDYETTTTTPYVLTVHATDMTATFRTGTATVSITLTDVNDNTPACTASLYAATLAEDATVGTSVITVACTDSDAISTVTYSLTSAEFTIDGTTGQIDTAAALNAETATSYDLTVTASDGTLSTDVTVTITVTNVNDVTPVFNPAGPYTVNIDENQAIGTTIYDIDATDGDISGTTFVFSITAGDTGGIFTIGTSSGIIQQQRSIDRDNPLTPSYTLTVSVADGSGAGALAATTTITINIDDLNDNSPTCNSVAFSTTASELTATGTSLFTPVCSDLDVVASPTLAYSITSGNAEGKFQINGGSGQLDLLSLLDYETTTSYTLTVAVDDQGTPNLITTLSMTVYVDPENEHDPVFQGTPYDSSISESVSLGHQVVRLSATDQDTGSTHGDLRYSIINGNAAGHFSVDASTGWLTVVATLDRESTASYTLTVGASDMLSTDGAARTASVVMTITILDENDNYPQINPATYAVTVNENAAVGANIVQVQATDDDDGVSGTAGLLYTITAGNTGNKFSMTGDQVTLAATVDAATLANYVLTVKVEDQGTPVLSSFTLVSISVTAINDHAPGFTVSQETITLSESETLGSSIYTVAASDADTGDFGMLRYYLRSGNTNSEFSVDQFNGDVRVSNSLDYDVAPTVYTLSIEVEDTASSTTDTLTSTFTLTVSLVDANDETPIFTMNLYSGTVNENVAVSTSVITVTANDADTGTNSVITYSILSGTGASTFSIDSTTGVVSTAVAIDYETNTLYDLKIRAVDGGTTQLSATSQVQIAVNDLNDNTPVFSVVNIAITIPEDTSIGTTVATAGATDADSSANSNNVIGYAFSVASSVFTINPTTAAITTTNLVDRDTVSSHTLTVIAVDGGTPVNSATATYTVILSDVNDNDPVITGTPYDVTFAEDTPQNTIVLQIVASDPDIDQNAFLTFSINSGNTDTDFFIDSGSGIIQVSNTLDRERTPVYTLEVVVVDSGTPARSAIVSATVTVSDVNDNAPIFQPDPTTTYTFTVSENVPVGTLVNSVSATDADTGTNAAIQFVIAQYILGTNTHFALDAQTGDITTAATLDRETQDTYSFIVRASDAGTSTLTSTVTVSITVDDFNDNIPNFSETLYTASTTENQPVGTSILTVIIDDVDISVNDDITLSINTTTTAGTRADTFIALDSSTYTLSVKQSIDREMDATLSFILIATDGGTPPLSFTTSVLITIGDENDERPIFAPTFYNSEIPYNDGCQVTATTLTATDADTGVNAALTYAFTQNNNPHLFTLDTNSGAITIVATTAKDTGYIMYAAATDGGSPALTTDTGATVRIDTYDANERVLNYYMDIPLATYLTSEATFLSQLSTVYQQTYPTAQAKRWCTAEVSASSCVVRVYVIKDDTADDVSELANDKQFLTRDEAYVITAADDAGTPASVIQGVAWTSFVITRVEKYYYVAPEEEETPWVETTTGLIVLIIVGAVVLIIIIALIGFAVYTFREKSRKNRVEVGDDEDGGDHVAKNQFYPKTRQMQNPEFTSSYKKKSISFASQLEKPLSKGGPYPTVVSLPTPSSVKKVPLQATKDAPPAQDFNLLYRDGPTLVKSPPKLRPSSPIMSSTVAMPRTLAPKPTMKPPAYSLNDTDGVGPSGPGDNDRYRVTNREFDGRAIDPKTGRTYEFNTTTNERRWLDSAQAPSTRATLRRDDDNDLYQSSSES